MGLKAYPVIDLAATGDNIRRLRMARGLTVRDLQSYFGFAEPRAIYKWQKGESLPTVDNLYALGALFEVPMDQILVPVIKLHIVSEQQAESCCSHHFLPGYFGYGKRRDGCHFLCAQGRKAPARHTEGVRPQNLRAKFMKGGLPACPWRRKRKSRNAGKSKGRFRRKSVWRWRKSRTQDFFILAGS